MKIWSTATRETLEIDSFEELKSLVCNLEGFTTLEAFC